MEPGRKTIELIRCKTPSEISDLDPDVIEAFPGRNVTLVASPNRLVLFDYARGTVAQSLSFPRCRALASASLHPSGHHVLLAYTDRLQLANVLVDGIVSFWEERVESCEGCAFNQRGTLFAALCGTTIIIYDFLDGSRVLRIDCHGTRVAKVKWGANCTVHAICNEGSLCKLRKWDAVTGESLAQYSSPAGDILAYSLTAEGKTLVASSENSLTYLNRDLQHDSTVDIGEEHRLNGAICVSDEGLVFASLSCRGNTTGIIRIFSAVGGDYFDTPSKDSITVMETNGRHLITNKALFQIKDRRGYNQYITSLDLSSSEDCSATDNQAEVLLVTHHVESKDALLSDLESKLTEVEMMNDLQLRNVHQGHSDELRLLRKSYHDKLSELREHTAQLLGDKTNLAQRHQLGGKKETKSAQMLEIHRLEEKYKNDILKQVNEHCRIEEDQNMHHSQREEERESLRLKHEKELLDFRLQAETKLAIQRETKSQLESQMAAAEHKSKETIAQLEEEIDVSISKLEAKLAMKIRDERDTSERLAMESDIVRRRMASTQETIGRVREQAAVLLQKEEEIIKLLKTRGAKKERLDVILTATQAELTSKKDAVSRLTSSHRHLQKAGKIEKERLHEVQQRTQQGSTYDLVNKATQAELLATTVDQEQQRQLSVSMQEKIVKLRDCVSVEQQEVVRLENKIRSSNSIINSYLAKLEECSAAIQHPKKLSAIVRGLAESVASAGPPPQGAQADRGLPTDEAQQYRGTVVLLEKASTLDELKAEETALAAKCREEKAKQIIVNGDLLNSIAGRADTQRRRSSLFKH